MDDPASRIPGQLLPHLHLVSRNRYPTMHMLPTDTVIDYLVTAPKIARELQPMHWTFLDGPPDGSVMLTWQPLNHLGTNFASDGYVWADVEQAFTFEARGYTVEMWLHRSGYHPPNETIAIHSRRRYRLVPPKVTTPAMPSPDPSLWIVHYSRASQTDQVSANRIPILPQTQSMLAQRRFLQSQGQLARKDFMLQDRNSWPSINLPAQMVPVQGYVHPGAASDSYMAGRQTGAFYPPQQPRGVVAPTGGAPMKVPRGHHPSASAVNAVTADFAVEDEDVSTGDLLDLLTPREISKMRYQQHHEWMEEIFASPYKISQIAPVPLGLGRKGELEALTSGFFEAPVGPSMTGDSKEAADPAHVANMELGKAEEFADRVAKKVEDMTVEIERIKKRHARRMEKFNRSSLFKDAEFRLRDAASDPDDIGSEIWRLEGRIEVSGDDDNQPAIIERKAKYKVDDIVREVEKSNKLIVPEPKISCVQKGGLLERIEPEGRDGREGFEDGDITMGQTESHFLDQFGTPATATPIQESSTSTQPSHPVSSGNAEQPQGPSTSSARHNPNVSGIDVDMLIGEEQPTNAAEETGDWVMVSNEAKKPPGGGRLVTGFQSLAGGSTGSAGENSVESVNFDFTNINSAGDALVAYGEQNDGLDLPDLDNSAFGDAFHASDNEHTHDQDADDMS